MKSTEQKIIKFIKRERLLERGNRILLALSGGPDSVFALHFLAKFRGLFGIEISAYHLNHMLRGKDADEDERFCVDLCEKYKIELVCERKNVREYAAENKLSIEEAARVLRYQGMENACSSLGTNKIITAHNETDNTETVLLNLLKGSGTKGLAGIPIKRENIIRPFLVVTAEEIRNYLSSAGIEARIDKSNFENDYQRNILRNEILPTVREKINPAVDEAIFRNSRMLNEANQLINNEVLKLWESVVSEKENRIEIKINGLEELRKGPYGLLFRYCFEERFSTSFTYTDYIKIYDLMDSKVGTTAEFSSRLKGIRERNSVIFFGDENNDENNYAILRLGEEVDFEGIHFGLKEVKEFSLRGEKNRNTEYFNLDETDEEFILRRWKAGDKFIPFGKKGKKNLSEFLVDEKVEAFQKKRQLILQNRNNIVWVVGLRLDNRYRINKGTKRIGKIWMS